jgi:putative colanic acid biosysnthesis UDP-glucose lipid carrier transferase
VVGVMKISTDILRNLALVPADDFDRDLDAGARRLQNAKLKTLFDFIGALLGLTVLLPFLLVVALAIVVDSRGPVLFRQRRTGYDGVPFVIYKFRTMHVQEDGPEVAQAMRDDERTTRIGRFLRRSSIDELPQLLNILKGDMSLVGPRPHALAHDLYYAARIPGYRSRFKAKPGITGLAQVSGLRGEIHHIEHMEARVRNDIDYIRNWSFGSDVEILLRTLITVPRDTAAY